MPPNQDKTSNGKQIVQIVAHNYFVFYSCIESTHKPGSDTTVGERSNNSNFSTHHQEQSMESSSNEREKSASTYHFVDRERKRSKER